ncbi:methyltransferase [Candidatus Woesearchaeota archaeon]|nr:methyltransferase [Candidatus Woesearchaeota archaeon]
MTQNTPQNTAEIYEPAEDSHFLQTFVREHAFGRVLDMGTGLGIQALTAIQNPNVREVVAVDINPEAIKVLRQKIDQGKLRKLTVIMSDLFEKVHGLFNTIIFNPPYLPQDKGIEDPALYGGNKGWELSARFLQETSSFLFPDGKILFLFSSLTNKKKIVEIIRNNLFEFIELERKKLPLFEELYVYEIKKSSLLRELEKKGIEQISYFTKGKRGVIYKGNWDKSKFIKSHFAQKNIIPVAIKVEHEESEAIARIANETKWIQAMNQKGIGPKYLFHTPHYVVYEFVEGVEIMDWIQNASKTEIITLLDKILRQCLIMDQLNVSKEEMHHPMKHIIVDKFNQPVMIDFERCSNTDTPKNVTQFVEFICRMGPELSEKKLLVDISSLRDLAKEYKQTFNPEILKSIINSLH